MISQTDSLTRALGFSRVIYMAHNETPQQKEPIMNTKVYVAISLATGIALSVVAILATKSRKQGTLVDEVKNTKTLRLVDKINDATEEVKAKLKSIE